MCYPFLLPSLRGLNGFHHGVFSTRDFYIGLPSRHLEKFREILRKLVLESAAIPWWTGALGYFSGLLKVTALLATSKWWQVSLASWGSLGRIGAWVLSSCMGQGIVTLKQEVTSLNPCDP